MRQSEPYTVGRAVAQIRRFEADEATGTQTGTVPGDVYTVKAMIMGPRRWPSRAWLQTPVEDVHDTQIERKEDEPLDPLGLADQLLGTLASTTDLQPAVATEDGFFDPLVVDDDSASVLCLLDSIRRMLPEATDAWEAQLREAQIGSIGYSRQITSINASIPIAQSARISKTAKYQRDLGSSHLGPVMYQAIKAGFFPSAATQSMHADSVASYVWGYPAKMAPTILRSDFTHLRHPPRSQRHWVNSTCFVVYTQAVCDDLTSQWSKNLYDFGIELGLAEGDLLMQVWWINKVLEKYLVDQYTRALWKEKLSRQRLCMRASEIRRDLVIGELDVVQTGSLSLSGLCPTPSLSVLVQDHGYSLVELVRGYTPEDRRPNKTLYPRRYVALLQGNRPDRLLQSIVSAGAGIQFNPSAHRPALKCDLSMIRRTRGVSKPMTPPIRRLSRVISTRQRPHGDLLMQVWWYIITRVSARLSGGWSGVYPSATPLSSICPRRWDDSPPYFMQYSVEPYPDCLVERSLARSPDTEPFFPYEWVDDYVPVEGDKPTHLSATATTLRLAILSVLGLRAINKNYFSLLSTHLDVLGLGFDTELQTAKDEQGSLAWRSWQSVAMCISMNWSVFLIAYGTCVSASRQRNPLAFTLAHVLQACPSRGRIPVSARERYIQARFNEDEYQSIATSPSGWGFSINVRELFCVTLAAVVQGSDRTPSPVSTITTGNTSTVAWFKSTTPSRKGSSVLWVCVAKSRFRISTCLLPGPRTTPQTRAFVRGLIRFAAAGETFRGNGHRHQIPCRHGTGTRPCRKSTVPGIGQIESLEVQVKVVAEVLVLIRCRRRARQRNMTWASSVWSTGHVSSGAGAQQRYSPKKTIDFSDCYEQYARMEEATIKKLATRMVHGTDGQCNRR
ncbi:hypothetical protein GN244_ATG19247 [Phytophthora infestans]|uniref:Uncharacterized protein n=1 Tax=Phytophthora infestans TaxID=4787 RepID=A0A833W590_PHYIN|nr:hypothetical protein GN244_ATG19247 [Phytophthora infestans]